MQSFICIYIYIFTHIHIYAFICLYVYIFTAIRILCVRLFVYIFIYLPIYINTYTYIFLNQPSALSCCGRLIPGAGPGFFRLWVGSPAPVLGFPWKAEPPSRPAVLAAPRRAGAVPALPFAVNYLLALLLLERCWWLSAGPSCISTQAPLISKLVCA